MTHRSSLRVLALSVLVFAQFSGTGRAQAPPAPQPLSLTLEDAIARGLRESLTARLMDAAVVSARGERWAALSDLLPSASAHVGVTRQDLNLASFGISVPGFPSYVPPFNVHDSRLSVTVPVVDTHALYEARSGAASLRAAELDRRDTRTLVALAVRDLYLRAIAAESRLNAARAQSATADALYRQATDLKSAGIVAGIDVLRAQVQVGAQEQRAIVAGNEFEKAKLQLARVIGLPLNEPFTLADEIPYAPLDTMSLEDALKQALASRDDYRAAQARLQAAELSKHAALLNNLPSIHVNADYGRISHLPVDAHNTYSVLAQLRIPLFEAADTRGHVLEADGLLQRRRAELDDFRARVEYEVRAAYLDLRAADQQLKSAQQTVDLANQELAQTRDRFAAGVAGNVEVVQAQEAVAAATESYISSLYAHNLAKASLAHAIGTGS